jgi:phage tail-like protein
MPTRTLKALLVALFPALLCALILVPTATSAQAPQKAPRPKMRPMGSPNTVISGHHFGLQINDVTVANFQEVGGLKSENEVAEYRGSGNNNPLKIPGRTKIGDITLKRGVIAGTGQLNAWLNTVRNKRQPKREQITIVEYNETGQTVQVFKLKNAWATKWKGPNLSGKGNGRALEELVLSYEDIEIVPPK